MNQPKMIGQSRKGLASFHASVSFWCLSSLKIGRKNGAVSLILVSFVLNYKCSDFFCQSAFIYKIKVTPVYLLGEDWSVLIRDIHLLGLSKR